MGSQEMTPGAEPLDCVIYARYSSHNQREVSIEQQVKECEDYARYNGLRVVKVYADRALTGTSDKRPQFQKMLKDAERGRWAYVLCWKVDRFARNRYDSATYKYRLKRNGVRVIYAKESIPDGPEGILLESILEGSAEYYSANLAQNVKRGLRFNAEACLSNGRIPYGYRKGADGHFEILESEAAVVREIFERSAAGEQYARILEDLKARGVPTRRGGQWRPCTLRVILLNEVYKGVYHFGDVRVEGGVPRIVDDELWEGAHKRLEAAKGTRVYSATYLFTGKIRCGLCGEPMTGKTGTGRSGTYAYYICKGQREKRCNKKAVRQELLEGRVVSCVLDALNDDGLVNWIADAVDEMQKREVEKSRVAPDALKAELAGVKKSIKGIMAAIEAGVFTASTKGRLLELEGEQERLEAAIADASIPVPSIDREAFVCWLTRFRGVSNLDEETRREAVNALVWQVRVWDDHAEAVLNYAGSEEIVHVPLLDGSGGGSPDGDKGCGEYHKISELLIKNSSLHPGVAHYEDMEPYYRALPREQILASPVLMSGMSMLCAMCMDYEGSEEWYRELERYAAGMKRTHPEYRTVRSRLAWLDIGLPQRNVNNFLAQIPALGRMLASRELMLPEFSVTSRLPSIMNGGKDFCAWSKRDKEIYRKYSLLVTLLLGRDGVKLPECAIAESQFEKGADVSGRVLDLLAHLEVIQNDGTPDIEFALIGLLVRLRIDQGEAGRAREHLEALRQRFQETEARRLLPNLDALLCRVAMYEGDDPAVDAWYKDKAPKDLLHLRVMLRYQYMTRVMVEIAYGRYQEAQLIMAPLRTYFSACRRVMDSIYLNLLAAICSYRAGDKGWQGALRLALDACLEYQFIRPVSQYGAAVLPLLEKSGWTEDGPFLERLAAATRKQAVQYPDFLCSRSRLSEPLSSAEMKVLRLLCHHKSNAEIGEILGIKLPTVKTYVSGVLRKLGVKNRGAVKDAAIKRHLF